MPDSRPASLPSPPRPPRAALREALILVAFLLLSVGLTWPLCAHFNTAIGGDRGDHWQTLWGMWWVKKALLDLHQNPLFSRWVFWPHDVPLVFETFDFPDCLLALPLWSFLPPIGVFNTVELSSYVLAGYFFYHFALELTDHAPASFLAAALFTFAPYHFGHALGHLHIVAMQWVPLYFWMLERAIVSPLRRWPLLAAVALAAASLASWYYLLFCVVLTLPYLAWRVATEPELRNVFELRRALLLGAAYLAILWPLFSTMLEERARLYLGQPAWSGGHDANVFSADLWSFFVPGATQALGSHFSSVWGRFSGNPAENCDYLGYALLCLAVLGAIVARRARIWLGIAALGVLLALGPSLRIGGEVHWDAQMPYHWLTRAVPLLDFTGCPVRTAFVAVFALCTAAALGLAWLLRPGPRRLARSLAAGGLLLVAGVELWPRGFTTSSFPVPAIFDTWAQDPSTFAVLDMSGDTRPLYNAVLHGHPIAGAYLSRGPLWLAAWLDEQPVIGHLRHASGGLGPPHVRRDPTLDFDWDLRSPMPELGPQNYQVQWKGRLNAPVAGSYTLTLGADDSGVLWIDGRPILENGGTHSYLEKSVQANLSAGWHDLAVAYRQETGGAAVRLLWARDGQPNRIVPAEALEGPDGKPGLEGLYRQVGNSTGLPREVALQSLREIQLRYIILPSYRREPLLEGELGLRPIYVGEGLRIYEVPPA